MNSQSATSSSDEPDELADSEEINSDSTKICSDENNAGIRKSQRRKAKKPLRYRSSNSDQKTNQQFLKIKQGQVRKRNQTSRSRGKTIRGRGQSSRGRGQSSTRRGQVSRGRRQLNIEQQDKQDNNDEEFSDPLDKRMLSKQVNNDIEQIRRTISIQNQRNEGSGMGQSTPYGRPGFKVRFPCGYKQKVPAYFNQPTDVNADREAIITSKNSEEESSRRNGPPLRKSQRIESNDAPIIPNHSGDYNNMDDLHRSSSESSLLAHNLGTRIIENLSEHFDERNSEIDRIDDAEIVRPETVRPKIVRPEIVRPEIVRPEIVRTEILRPASVRPGIGRPANVRPENENPTTHRRGSERNYLNSPLLPLAFNSVQGRLNVEDEESYTQSQLLITEIQSLRQELRLFRPSNIQKPDFLPCKSVQDVKSLQLIDVPTENNVLKYLENLGGDDVKDACNLRLQSIVEDKVLDNFTWHGKQNAGQIEKLAFKKCKVVTLIKNSLLNQTFNQPSTKQCEESIKDVLRLAKQRTLMRFNRRSGSKRVILDENQIFGDENI